MADDDAGSLQIITDNIEGLYQALRLAAANITGLLQLGVATCDEVRAYNLWALATYNAQRGMLAVLRANGATTQTGGAVPELPQNPTLFTWRGVSGGDALNIDCAGEESSLSGAMKKALRGPVVASKFLSMNDIAVNTTDAHLMNPQNSPSFAMLTQRQQQQGLGVPVGVVIIVASIFIFAAVAVVAIMSFLKSSSIQESNSKQVRAQAEAFANYTDARLQCQQRCTSSGGEHNACVKQCSDLIGKPNIKLPDEPFASEWGILEWTGLTVILGGVGYIAWRAYERKKSGKPMFKLPDFHHDT